MPTTRRPPAQRRAAGWLPAQHGAWAMLLLPFIAGVWLSGPRVAHIPLGLLWLVGYLDFYAVGRWLRSRRNPRELAPTLAYTAAVVPLGLTTLATSPGLLPWAAAYLPLLAASLWLIQRGAERSIANDAVTIVAATLMAPVAFDAGGGGAGGGGDWAAVWVASGVLLAYFLGTVVYVKTMIRERGRRGYVAASVAYHLLGVAAAAASVASGWQRPALVVVWVALTARAAAGPAINRRRARPLRPVVVGVGEIVASVAITVVTLTGLPAG